MGTKREQEPQSRTRMGAKWEQSGNQNLKWEQELQSGTRTETKWEQEQRGNEVGTRILKWDKKGNKVGTNGTKWQDMNFGSCSHFVSILFLFLTRALKRQEWEQSRNKKPKVEEDQNKVGTKREQSRN